MKPLKLHVENFIGIERADIEFEPGVYVLVGRNGSGKSSLFEAVHFALYGSPVRTNVYSSIRMGARHAEVKFEFEFGGKVYSILRRIDRSKNHRASFRENGSLISGGATDISKRIVEMTGIDSKTFIRFFFIPQERITEVVEAGSDLKSVIMRLMKFEDMVKFMKEALKSELEKLGFERVSAELESVESELQKIGDPDSLRKHLIRLDSSLESSKSKLESIETELKSVEMNLKGLEEVDLEKLRKDISRLEELVELEEKIKKARELKPLLRNIRSLERERSEKEEKLKRLERENSDLKSHLKSVEEKIEKWKSRLEDLERERKNLTYKIEKLREIHSKSLPLLVKLKSLEDEISKLERERESSEVEFDALEKEIEKISSEIEDRKSKLSDLERKLERFEEEEISWMAWKIASQLGEGSKCPVCGGTIEKTPKEVSFDPKVLERIENELGKIKDEISELETRRKILLGKREELEKRIEKLEKDMVRLKDEISEIEKMMINLGYFDGIEKEIENLDGDRRKVDEERENLMKELSKLEREESRLIERMESNAKAIESLEDEIEKKIESLKDLRSELEEALKNQGLSEEEVERLGDEKVRGYSEKLARLRERLESYEKRIGELKSKGLTLEKLKEMKENLESERRKILKEIEELSKERGRTAERLRRSTELVERFKKLKDDLENIEGEKRIIENLIEAFGSKNFINYVFNLVFGKILNVASSRFHSMTRGKFKLKLGSDGKFEIITSRGSLDPKQLSGGERTLLALSLITAVSDVLVGKVGLLFVDEGFAALDEFNRELVADVLRGFDVHERVIIFITHAEDLKEKFERKLIMREGVLEVG